MMKKGNYAVTVICCLSMLSHGLLTTATGPLLTTVQQAYHVTSAAVSLLYTFMSVGSITAVFISAYLFRKTNFRTVAISAQLLMAIFLLVFASTGNLMTGVISYTVLGLSGGLIQVTTNTVISTLNSENRAPALNLLHFSFGLGALSGPLISGFILQYGISWNYVYYIMAAYSVMVSILYLFIRFPLINSGKSKGNMAFLKYFKSTYFVLMIFAIVIYVGVEMGINSWSVNYTHEKHNLGNLTASSILSYFWVFMTAGRLLCIPLTKRFRPSLVMLILISFSVLAFITYVFSSHVVLSFISISIIGFCFSGVFPILLSLGGNRYKEGIGSVTIVFMAFSCLGIMFFPLLTGVIKDSLSLNSGMKMLLAFDAILAVLMFFIYKKSSEKINS